MHVEVVGLRGVVFSGDAAMVVLPTQLGEIGILPGHAHLGGLIHAGRLRIKPVDEDGHEFSAFVAGGVFEVSPSEVSVMVDVFARQTPDNAEKSSLTEIADVLQTERKQRLDFSKIQNDLNETLVRAESFYKVKKGFSSSNK
jgi:F-type H+-transporting ATPase subunit epsilon